MDLRYFVSSSFGISFFFCYESWLFSLHSCHDNHKFSMNLSGFFSFDLRLCHKKFHRYFMVLWWHICEKIWEKPGDFRQKKKYSGVLFLFCFCFCLLRGYPIFLPATLYILYSVQTSTDFIPYATLFLYARNLSKSPRFPSTGSPISPIPLIRFPRFSPIPLIPLNWFP